MPREQAQGAPQEQAGQKERAPRVYLNLPEQPYVRRNIQRRDGKTFNEVSLPKNMRLGDKIMGGGWRFNPLYVNVDERRPGMVSIPLLLGNDVLLQKDIIMRDQATGAYIPIMDPDGKPLKERISVNPLDLKAAFDQALVEASGRSQPQRQSLDAQAAEANVQESARESMRAASAPSQQREQTRHAAAAI